MTALERMKAMAAQESRLVPKDDPLHPDTGRHKGVAARLQPFIGSGMTMAQIGKALGCSDAAVCKAFKRIGAAP